MAGQPVRVAMIGLGFGAEFIPIYQRHPQAEMAAICRRDQAGLDEVGDQFGVEKRYTDYRDLLKDPDIDAVHINSPIPDHAWMTVEALKAGKHVACTVPMATSIEDCKQIVGRGRADRPQVHDDGDRRLCPRVPLHQAALRLGRARQAAVPAGQPHAGHGRLARLLARAAADVVRDALRGPDARADRRERGGRLVLRLGHDPRGADRALRVAVRGRDRAREAARLATSPHASIDRCSTSRASIARASTSTAPSSRSSGRSSRASSTCCTRPSAPSRRSPRRSTSPTSPSGCPRRSSASRPRASTTTSETHLSFTQGAGHGGSHPHLVHEFVSALVEQREPFPNARRSANWTCVGLCAHESALKGGELVRLPEFTLGETLVGS